jgi:UDP-N-acetylglucosamine--N-acetylmuramyl-(pentapeptide) pyrophosphoryl-undecaprenol N-acetylglucosamine transferase
MSSKSVVFAGGGTAGHVNPLLAMARALQKVDPDVDATVIGTDVGLEIDLVPAAGFRLETIEKVPFPRRPNADALKFPAKWLKELRRTKQILQDAHADVVVGVGGYAAAPAYRAAHSLGIPIVIHEQNARAGMANKMGAKWASFVGTTYDDTGIRVGKSGKMQRVGLPLREEVSAMAARIEAGPHATRVECAHELGLDPNRLIVVVTGGSQGAASINGTVAASASRILEKAQVLHVTGKGKDDAVRQAVSAIAGNGDYHIVPYLERMDLALGCADLVIGRSGAGTVAENSALGVGAIYVPLPYGNGEQRLNALPVVGAGGGVLVDDADFTPDWISQNLIPLLGDPQKLGQMGETAWHYGIRDADMVMAKIIDDLLES